MTADSNEGLATKALCSKATVLLRAQRCGHNPVKAMVSKDQCGDGCLGAMQGHDVDILNANLLQRLTLRQLHHAPPYTMVCFRIA